MSELASALVDLQANLYVLYAQAHGFHWNVKGMMFKELHAFFNEIYEDVYDSIDPVSENIRKLGADAPFGLSTWISNATLSVVNEPNLSAYAMCANLAETNDSIVTQLKMVFRIANAEDEQGVANYIAERIDKHQFWAWQLKATLQTLVV